MAVQFNPFTGNLDIVGAGAGAVASPGGSDTQVQFNDGGSFGGDDGLTFNKTTNALTSKGDLNLDDGGTYTTTLQTVTATANRTISFPDATGTVALVAGSSGQFTYNNAGAQAGLTSANIGSTGAIDVSLAGAASTPPVKFTGTWFTGGTATTTKPQVLIEPTGTTSTAWSTSGTGLGVNAASGFAGNLLDLQVNGTSRASISAASGAITITNVSSSAAQIISNSQYRVGAIQIGADFLGGNAFTVGSTAVTPADIAVMAINGINIRNTSYFGWSSSTNLASSDLSVFRDAAGTLAQRNGTNAQAFRCYGTYTDASNYVRAALSSTSTAVTLAAETAGTGDDNIPLNLSAAGTGTVNVNSDLVVEGGSAFDLTLQAVTPTADRTITFPDSDGVVGLVAGSSGQLIYNNAGAYGAISTLTADSSGNLNLSGRFTNSYNSIADNPAKRWTGTWFTGGTATTTKPHVLIEPTGTTSTAWSTSGTGLGVNAPSGFGGNLLDLQVNGTSKFSVDNNGKLSIPGTVGLISIIPVGNTVDFSIAGLPVAGVGLTYFGVTANADLRWTSSITDPTAISDLSLFRDAANTLAQRNGTNAQTYRLYNTYTDASNYERGFLRWDSNVFKIGTEVGATGGSARSLEIELNGTTRAIFGPVSQLTIPGTVSQVFVDCTTYFAATNAANSRALAGNGFTVGSAYGYGFSSTTGANGTQDIALVRNSAGVVKVTNGSTGTGYIKQDPVAVSALPSAATVGAGTRGFVNDANATTFASVVAGGGANVVPVYSDGTDWRIG